MIFSDPASYTVNTESTMLYFRFHPQPEEEYRGESTVACAFPVR